MAVRQINTAAYNYSMMLEVINKSYKGKADITISEYDSDAAPDVKVGSVWDDNGAIFILETADMTPTGYAGISNSVTFYLYFDESASVFIYSETVPTWSDVKQGWYNSDDRAFFSMFKDSGGTLYEDKSLLLSQNNFEVPNNLTIIGGIDSGNNGTYLKTNVYQIGSWNMDTTSSKNVAHGLSDHTKIRSMSAMIVDDNDNFFHNIEAAGHTFSANATNIVLTRDGGGVFDAANYTIAANRGWVYIVYEV